MESFKEMQRRRGEPTETRPPVTLKFNSTDDYDEAMTLFSRALGLRLSKINIHIEVEENSVWKGMYFFDLIFEDWDNYDE